MKGFIELKSEISFLLVSFNLPDLGLLQLFVLFEYMHIPATCQPSKNAESVNY